MSDQDNSGQNSDRSNVDDNDRDNGNFRASNAGHQGLDRQPVTGAAKSTTRLPDPQEAARPDQVQKRSREADKLQHKDADQPDFNHPGPDRMEAEKSKGNLHKDQHEGATDIQKKFDKL